jgi:hypothetical protein
MEFLLIYLVSLLFVFSLDDDDLPSSYNPQQTQQQNQMIYQPKIYDQPKLQDLSPPQRNNSGIIIYDESECRGRVINGECHGMIVPKPRPHKRCYGTVSPDGRCLGGQHY